MRLVFTAVLLLCRLAWLTGPPQATQEEGQNIAAGLGTQQLFVALDTRTVAPTEYAALQANPPPIPSTVRRGYLWHHRRQRQD